MTEHQQRSNVVASR